MENKYLLFFKLHLCCVVGTNHQNIIKIHRTLKCCIKADTLFLSLSVCWEFKSELCIKGILPVQQVPVMADRHKNKEQ